MSIFIFLSISNEMILFYRNVCYFHENKTKILLKMYCGVDRKNIVKQSKMNVFTL